MVFKKNNPGCGTTSGCLCKNPYKLTNCDNEGEVIYSRSDLEEYLGKVVTLEESGTGSGTGSGYTICYIVEEATETPPGIEFEEVTVVESFESCEECNPEPCPSGCYRLTLCETGTGSGTGTSGEVFYSNSDLSEYLDRVIYIGEGEREGCWLVECAEDGDCDEPDLSSCSACESGTVPAEFIVEFTGYGAGCTHLNAPLVLVRDGSNLWRYDHATASVFLNFCAVSGIGGGKAFQVRVVGSGGTNEYALQTGWPRNCSEINNLNIPTVGSTSLGGCGLIAGTTCSVTALP